MNATSLFGRSLSILRPRLGLFLAGLALLAGMGMTLPGCAAKKPQMQPPPAPTYTGPECFYGTVGSLAAFRGLEPMLVSGYGLVVDLPGTGSNEVPPFLRQWLINEMKKMGLGSARLETLDLTPERVLADTGKSVVEVQGLIPPGATRGHRFDVLVSAIDMQTTSLEFGRLWTTDLAIEGANRALLFSQPLAKAGGDLYINPLENSVANGSATPLPRNAVILSGGVVTEDRVIELVLNQASWLRSREIADRINERFPANPTDRHDTAEPKTALLIQINIPRRYIGQSDQLLRLISKLYLQRAVNFEPQQAQRLLEVLRAKPAYVQDIALAWVALGKTVLPTLRGLYTDADFVVQMAALQAGTMLEDETATDYLIKIVQTADPATRQRCAALLVHLPRSLRGARALKDLLDDPDRSVRIAAYESLAHINDPLIQRTVIGNREKFKFVLDLVPARRPLVYICQAEIPRLVIFNPDTGFKMPMVARLWDNHLMLRGKQPDQPLTVFYQPIVARGGEAVAGITHEIVPTLANLVFLLTHTPDAENPTPGFDLSYSNVVNAVYNLHRAGVLAADLEMQINPLAKAIADAAKPAPTMRPESGATTQPATAPASDLQPVPQTTPAP